MVGIFKLRTPRDLLAKLRREYERLRKKPTDTDTAFNFFVTAEHILDWLYPGKKNEAKRKAARKAEVLLQVVSHIASGAKHFDDLSGHHQSVQRSDFVIVEVWVPPVMDRPNENHIGIRLTGDAAAAFGDSLTAVGLAQRVLAFWESYSHPDLA
jgi:hypothetical protein